jgi:hypothetical protein
MNELNKSVDIYENVFTYSWYVKIKEDTAVTSHTFGKVGSGGPQHTSHVCTLNLLARNSLSSMASSSGVLEGKLH